MLLHKPHRDGAKNHKRALNNLSDLSATQIEAIRSSLLASKPSRERDLVEG